MRATAENAFARGKLDGARSVRSGWYERLEQVVAAPDDMLVFDGWCAAEHDDVRVALVTADGERTPIERGVPRPDLFDLYGEAGARAGFRSIVPMLAYAPGTHRFALVAQVAGEDVELDQIVVRIELPEPRREASRFVALDAPPAGVLQYPFGTLMRPTGWAADVDRTCAAASAAVVIDERYIVPARMGIARPDVANELGLGGTGLGFEALIAGELLSPGAHAFRAIAFTADGARIDAATAVSVDVDEFR